MSHDEKDAPSFLSSSYADWSLGIAIGMGFGIALGAALDHIGIGIALGASFAVVYALMMGDIKRRREEDDLARERAPRE